MLMKKISWFSLIAVIAVIGNSVIASPAFSEEKSGIANEGIKVHGHWKIEIFNPDGTSVSITEFDNALVNPYVISTRLVGLYAHGGWGIELDASTGTKPCDTSGSAVACNIGEAGLSYLTLTMHSTNLSVTSDSAWPHPIILSGTVTAANTSTINTVSSTYSYCGDDVSTSSCRTVGPNNVWQAFTTKTLASPPDVVPGQLIQVTVTISFS